MLDPVGGSVARNTGSVASWAVVRATGKRKASPRDWWLLLGRWNVWNVWGKNGPCAVPWCYWLVVFRHPSEKYEWKSAGMIIKTRLIWKNIKLFRSTNQCQQADLIINHDPLRLTSISNNREQLLSPADGWIFSSVYPSCKLRHGLRENPEMFQWENW